MQRLLNKAKCKPKLKVDGDFGPITEKAVIHFQTRYKKYLKVDGVYGPKTSYGLDAELNGPKIKLNLHRGSLADLAEEWEGIDDNARARGAYCNMPPENAAVLRELAKKFETHAKALKALFDEMDAAKKQIHAAMIDQEEIYIENERGGFVSKSWVQEKNKVVAKYAALGKSQMAKKFNDRLRKNVEAHNKDLESIAKRTGRI